MKDKASIRKKGDEKLLRAYIEEGYQHPLSGEWITKQKHIDFENEEIEKLLKENYPYGDSMYVEKRVLSVSVVE